MAPDGRYRALFSCGKGLLVAILVSLLGMCLIALVVMYLGVHDTTLTIVNQILKVVSICLGVTVAVGPGGDRGAAKGAITGLLYMILGYCLYALWGSGATPWAVLVGEFVSGAVVGALSGAITANRKPRKLRGRLLRKKATC